MEQYVGLDVSLKETSSAWWIKRATLNSISDPNRRESGIRRGGYENPSETHVS